MTDLARARWLALIVPVALLAGAYGAQLRGGLVPCEMCWWQRYPHFAAVPLALAAIALASRPPLSRGLTVLAALAIGVSGAIGVYHAGVEYHWWQGPAQCTSQGFTSIADLMAAKPVMCDVPQWTFLHVSLAGFNAIVSIAAALAVLRLATRPVR